MAGLVFLKSLLVCLGNCAYVREGLGRGESPPLRPLENVGKDLGVCGAVLSVFNSKAMWHCFGGSPPPGLASSQLNPERPETLIQVMGSSDHLAHGAECEGCSLKLVPVHPAAVLTGFPLPPLVFSCKRIAVLRWEKPVRIFLHCSSL